MNNQNERQPQMQNLNESIAFVRPKPQANTSREERSVPFVRPKPTIQPQKPTTDKK